MSDNYQQRQRGDKPPIVHELMAWFALLGSTLWLCYPGLLHSKVPAFRDAYHFYCPQAVWLDRQAKRGEFFPRWNAEEGLGVSVVGQPSSALYYPLRLLWFFPGLTIAQRFSLVVIVHIWIAAYGIRFAAHRLGFSNYAGWLAALSYSLSCPVFFQHANLIYLCSAAWIGFALGAIADFWYSRKRSGLWSCLVFSTSCALMLLAGDAHTTANAFIVAGLVAVASWWNCKPPRTSIAFLKDSTGWISGALLLVVIATAIQWIPTLRWVQFSARDHSEISDSALVSSELGNQLASTPAPVRRIYDFSVSPWHLVTCLWPTLGGSYVPSNSRLFAAIPAEGRMWLPSLYFGIIPTLLCLQAVKNCWHSRARWLVVIALFSLLAMLGSYTFIWVLREVCTWFGWTRFVAGFAQDQSGGPYALLVAVLPGYEYFRYPAKWSVWFAAACSLLAGWQCSSQQGHMGGLRSGWLCRLLAILSFVGLLLTITIGYYYIDPNYIENWLAAHTQDAWLGPAKSSAILKSLCLAFGIPGVVLTIASCTRSMSHALGLTILEMTLCASCWISFSSPGAALSEPLHLASSANPRDRPFVWTNTAAANIFVDRLSTEKTSAHLSDGPLMAASPVPTSAVEALCEYQDVFLLGKLASLTAVGNLGATQSIEPQFTAALKSILHRHDNLHRSQPKLDDFLRRLGISHRLIRTRIGKQAAKFEWVAIENPTSLCQVFVDAPSAVFSPAQVSWHWASSSSLEIQFKSLPSCVLQIRQINDGGWEAIVDENQKLSIHSSDAFIRVTVPANASRVTVRRKFLW